MNNNDDREFHKIHNSFNLLGNAPQNESDEEDMQAIGPKTVAGLSPSN